MKIRQGFVSNSSTTSFCIAGVGLSKKELKETFDVEEAWEIESSELSVYRNSDAGDYGENYVGLSIDRMLPDETRAQFEARASDLLSRLAGKPVVVSIFTEGWYNG